MPRATSAITQAISYKRLAITKMSTTIIHGKRQWTDESWEHACPVMMKPSVGSLHWPLDYERQCWQGPDWWKETDTESWFRELLGLQGTEACRLELVRTWSKKMDRSEQLMSLAGTWRWDVSRLHRLQRFCGVISSIGRHLSVRCDRACQVQHRSTRTFTYWQTQPHCRL